MIFNAGGLAAKVNTGWSLDSKGSPPGLSKSAFLTSTLPNDHKIIDMCVYTCSMYVEQHNHGHCLLCYFYPTGINSIQFNSISKQNGLILRVSTDW